MRPHGAAVIAFLPCRALAAWVLWVSERHAERTPAGGIIGKPGTLTWKIKTATEALDDCKVELNRALTIDLIFYKRTVDAMQLKDEKDVLLSSSDSGYIFVFGTLIIMAEYKCLPDTVDPRR